MNDRSNQPDSPRSPDPTRLVNDLRELYASPIAVPAAVDRAVLTRAKLRLAAMRRRRLLLAWGGGAAAAAALLLVGLRLLSAPGDGANLPGVRSTALNATGPAQSTRPGAGNGNVQDRQDLNGDGRVDILDAFFLARQLAAGAGATAFRPEWDINGDGIVDQRDVDALAADAVRLDSANAGPSPSGQSLPDSGKAVMR